MPVYEYQCSNCGEKTQRLQEVGEDSSGKRCLSCGDGAIRKTFSVFNSQPGAAPSEGCPAGEIPGYT